MQGVHRLIDVFDDSSEFVIVNTYNSDATTNLTVTKEWIGEDGKTAVSPGGGVATPEVTLTLMKRVGTSSVVSPVVDAEVFTVKSMADASQADTSFTWRGQPLYQDGSRVYYSVREDAVNSSDESTYELTSSSSEFEDPGESEQSVTVTNKLKPSVTPVNPDKPDDPDNPEALVKVTYADSYLGEDGSADKLVDGKEILSSVKVRQGDLNTENMKTVGAQYASNIQADGSASTLSAQSADATLSAQADATPVYVPEAASRDGYVFTGWTMNRDSFGDYLMLAHRMKPEQIVVSYVDAYADEDSRMVKTVFTDDESKVGAPDDPVHSGLIFKEWVRTVDAAGNVIYVAVYEYPEAAGSDSTNATTNNTTNTVTNTITGNGSVAPPASPARTGTSYAASGKYPSTGDSALDMLILFAALALLLSIVAVVLHNRRMNALRADASSEHPACGPVDGSQADERGSRVE